MIRTLLLLALLALIAAPAGAQDTFDWDPQQLVRNVDATDLETTFDVYITNTTNETRTYDLEFMNPPQPNYDDDGWTRAWCTHGFCYFYGFAIIPNELAPGETDDDCHAQIAWVWDADTDTTLYIHTRAYDQEFPDDYVETMFTLIIGDGSSVDNEPGTEQPLEYTLAPVYPNPFNAQATVNFTLPAPGNAALALYDVMGRQVSTLTDGFHAAGTHAVTLNGARLASGTYLLRMDAGQQQLMQRVTLVK